MQNFKYISINQEIEQIIKTIKKEIMLSMNGICAEKIEDSGMSYKQNFGVSWSRLQEIAHNHKQETNLAEALWWSSAREQRLLATLLLPQEAMTEQRIKEWATRIDTIEIAEIFSFAVTAKKREYTHIYKEWLSSEDNTLLQLASAHTIARLAPKMDECEKKSIINLLPANIETLSILRAVESFLCSTLHSCPTLCAEIENFIAQTSGAYAKTLNKNIKEEIEFCKSKR